MDDALADRLPAMGDDETHLPDSSSQRSAASRLSCQIVIGEQFDGMRATIAPEDWGQSSEP